MEYTHYMKIFKILLFILIVTDIVPFLQLSQEELARNELDARLMKTNEELKELQTKYETETAAKDSEILQLKDEVKNN